jgi:Tol biopolymer transport system component
MSDDVRRPTAPQERAVTNEPGVTNDPQVTQPPTIRRVSVTSDGGQIPAQSTISYSSPVVSDDGRYVVFATEAGLATRDDNGIIDVYRRNLETGRTVLVSATDGGVGNDYSHEPSLSASGRFVAFTSWATNLTRSDRNGSIDVLVKDMRTGRVERASRSSSGREVMADSFYGVISANGRFVAFQSFGRFGSADTDRNEDIYVRDRIERTTVQASVRSDGSDLPAHYLVGGISGDGQSVTFSDDNNAWLRNLAASTTTRLWHEANQEDFPSGTVGRVALSANGRFAAFSTRVPVSGNDTNHLDDIVRYSVASGARRVVTVGHAGPVGNDESYAPTISRTGRYVGFVSAATDLVRRDPNGQPDVFIRDVRDGTTTLASRGVDGPANNVSGRSSTASISRDGQRIAFDSYASNLVRRDTNDDSDVFLWVTGS